MTGRLIGNFIAASSKHNVFKQDAINDLRKNDNMIATLEKLCKIIEKNMAPAITYSGYEIIDHRIGYIADTIQMYDSDIYCVKFNFKITAMSIENDATKGKVVSIVKSMIYEIPKLINGDYYHINGVRFYPIYQLLDATTYHKDNAIMLKTNTIPIKLTRSPTQIIDINQRRYDTYGYYVEIQKKKNINIFGFFFAVLGFFETIAFFEGGGGNQAIFSLVGSKQVNPASTTYSFFEITKSIYLMVPNAMLFHEKIGIHVKAIIACILLTCPKKMTIANIFEREEFWKDTLFAMCFYKTKTPHRTFKIDKILNGYINLYDAFTQEIVNDFETPKRDIYEVLRWMFFNYNSIVRRDNWSIFNKRIRLSESQVSPIVRLITNKIRRVSNAKPKQLNHKKYGEILTLPYKERNNKNIKNQSEQPNGYLIKAIVNSSSTKYADAVNDMDLFNIFTKFTLTSLSTTASSKPRSNSLSLDRRASSVTHIGIISLNTTGAGDPGATGCFTPFARLYNGFFKPVRGAEDIVDINSLSDDDIELVSNQSTMEEPTPESDDTNIPFGGVELYDDMVKTLLGISDEEELECMHELGFKEHTTTIYNDDGSVNDTDDELDFTDDDFESDDEYAALLEFINTKHDKP
jgi:hypothetical protein